MRRVFGLALNLLKNDSFSQFFTILFKLKFSLDFLLVFRGPAYFTGFLVFQCYKSILWHSVYKIAEWGRKCKGNRVRLECAGKDSSTNKILPSQNFFASPARDQVYWLGARSAFRILTQQSPRLLLPAQRKISLSGDFCAPGRIRTFEARRRQIYSLVHLTTLPPTHFLAHVSSREPCAWKLL